MKMMTQPQQDDRALPNMAITNPALRLACAIGGRHRSGATDGRELAAEALLGLCESQRRHEDGRGPLTTFAFARMQGRALDALRRETRLHKARQALRECKSEADVAVGSISTRLDIGRAIESVAPHLSSAERIVLQGVYAGDRSMRELAAGGDRWSEDQLHRAHQRLLARLRAKLAPGPLG